EPREGDRLRDEGVHAKLVASRDVFVEPRRGKHDHRNVAQRLVLLDHLQGLAPTHLGHVEVQQDQSRARGLPGLARELSALVQIVEQLLAVFDESNPVRYVCVLERLLGQHPVGVDTGASPSIAWPYLASGNYFDSLSIQPYLGRFFHAADEHGANSAPYVVLSYPYWHGHFHDDAGVVGRAVKINKHPMTIIGVAPPAFRGTELFFAPAMWIPMVEQSSIEGYDALKYRGNHSE